MTIFRLIRTDLNADHVIVEGVSLLIGRAAACGLQLNHPMVARFHAGITLEQGRYWVSALTGADVLLNGNLIEHMPLQNGDLLQIGGFFLRSTPGQRGLTLTVEYALSAISAADSSTVRFLPQTHTQAPLLAAFWEQRLRELAAVTLPTHTTKARELKVWRPTLDLQRRWPRGLLGWGLLTALALVALTALTFPRAYAPGPLSAAHANAALPSGSTIARQASAGSCLSCHAPGNSLSQNCTACHTTPSFNPALSAKHLKLGLECQSCHTEHRGNQAALLSAAGTACLSCHRDGSQTLAGTGQPLQAPHGKAGGYPVRNGLWSWDGMSQTEWQRRQLPGRTSDYNLREQFHMLHTAGRRQGRAQCADCHLGGTSGAALKLDVRASCAQCHAAQTQAAPALSNSFVRCSACHTQHGAEKDLRASVRK